MTDAEIIDAARKLLAACEPRSVADLAESIGCHRADLLTAFAAIGAGIERCAPPDDLDEHAWWWRRTFHLAEAMAREQRRARGA